MAKVLVVDDSPVDRRVVGELLGRASGLEVDYAIHGADALARMESSVPDIIVTDLLMPEVDGFQLVTIARRKYPQVPIILMTSQGNEEIAVQSLQHGAASYVPKRVLVQRLLDTVLATLSVSAHERVQKRLLNRMASNVTTFVLDNDVELLTPLISYIQVGVTQMGVCEEADIPRLGVALQEALTNALYHGNLEVGSGPRECDRKAFLDQVEARRRQSPYRDRQILVKIKLARDRAVFVIRDAGPGFDFSALPDPTHLPNLERSSGRGIFLMRIFMDRVIYNPVGNAVTLIKYRRAAADSPERQAPEA